MTLQLRRGTTAERTAITPTAGEPFWDTEHNTLYIGDGMTAGGVVADAPSGSEAKMLTATDTAFEVGDIAYTATNVYLIRTAANYSTGTLPTTTQSTLLAPEILTPPDDGAVYALHSRGVTATPVAVPTSFLPTAFSSSTGAIITAFNDHTIIIENKDGTATQPSGADLTSWFPIGASFVVPAANLRQQDNTAWPHGDVSFTVTGAPTIPNFGLAGVSLPVANIMGFNNQNYLVALINGITGTAGVIEQRWQDITEPLSHVASLYGDAIAFPVLPFPGQRVYLTSEVNPIPAGTMVATPLDPNTDLTVAELRRFYTYSGDIGKWLMEPDGLTSSATFPTIPVSGSRHFLSTAIATLNANQIVANSSTPGTNLTSAAVGFYTYVGGTLNKWLRENA